MLFTSRNVLLASPDLRFYSDSQPRGLTWPLRDSPCLSDQVGLPQANLGRGGERSPRCSGDVGGPGADPVFIPGARVKLEKTICDVFLTITKQEMRPQFGPRAPLRSLNAVLL